MIALDKLSVFDSLPFNTWLLRCFKNIVGIGVGNDVWNARFAVTCWLIWKTCYANVFGGVGLHGVGLARYGSIVAADFAATHACKSNTRRLHQPPWCCPERRWVKVNCDGAVNSRDGTAAIGGVVRDSNNT
ncbi:hypothetical protein V6N12_034230 [Hibiscus sabdariffa]|uniref:RNase H type-1 domain-containing protein n=1 Tax=Hibiscus sabdariffa TaxID=183260 RepID=A0ABR2BH71_9ROSI